MQGSLDNFSIGMRFAVASTDADYEKARALLSHSQDCLPRGVPKLRLQSVKHVQSIAKNEWEKMYPSSITDLAETGHGKNINNVVFASDCVLRITNFDVRDDYGKETANERCVATIQDVLTRTTVSAFEPYNTNLLCWTQIFRVQNYNS